MAATVPAARPAARSKPSAAGVLSRFLVLKSAVPELWIVFAVKLLGSVAYKVVSMTLVLWLTYDLGFDDAHAGYYAGAWATVLVLFTVLVGSLTDAIGLRKAFLLGAYVTIAARVVMAFTSHKWLALSCGVLPLALGEALSIPVMVAATHRYSTTAQRSISFSIIYALMNAGFFIAQIIFDHVRRSLGEPHGHFVLPVMGIQLTTYQVLLFVALLFEVSLWPILYFGLRPGVEVSDEGVRVVPPQPARPGAGLWSSFIQSAGKAARETVRIFAGLWRQPGFYKFLLFLTLAAFVRLIFYQLDFTYPKFGIRELGPGAPIAHVIGINSILILFLVPLVGALSQKVAAYRMVSIGSAIAASSVFIMAMPPVWFEGLAHGFFGRWIGQHYLGLAGPIHPYYVMTLLFVVLLSVGESIYSPRLYEYAAAIAPKGQEGSYMALSYLPYFLAKLGVGMFSGVMLAKFCPETGPRYSQMLWLIIALTTAIAPVGLIVFRRFIRVKEAGRQD